MQYIIDHMNEHHNKELIGLCKKFSKDKDISNATLVGVDFGGLDIIYNDTIAFRVEFPEKASPETIKDAIIDLCKSLKDTHDVEAVFVELKEFMKSFGSIIISSIDENGMPVCSYAPLIQYNDAYYIYISEVAEHYGSISTNPDKLEVMFLEDESLAKSVILRRRARFKTTVTEIARESEEFIAAIATLVDSMNGFGGIKTINKMQDFHLFKLHFTKGRYVKAFGGAYDITQDGEVIYIGGSGNPHTILKKS